jgi:hypothetical protein
MRSRLALLALLVLVFGATGLTACGDGSSTTGSRASDNARADGRRSQAKLVPSAPRPGERRGHSAEEYQGPFSDGKEICGTSTHEKVAKIVGSRSTRPRAIAGALARGYKPKLRKQAYAGCLAGLR